MSDNTGQEMPSGASDLRSLAQRVLLYFSAVAGFSFSASAIIHELVFATWGLDFTAIATPNDVVMGGFRIITIFIPVLFVIATFTSSLSVFYSTRGRFNNHGWRRYSTAAAAVLLYGGVLCFSWISAEHRWDWMLSLSPYRTLAVASFIAVGTFTIVEVVALSIPLKVFAESIVSRWRFELTFSAAFSAVVLLIMLSYTSYLNIRFAGNATRLPSTCTVATYTATGLGYKIRWIGNDSVVVSCGRSWFVLLNFREHGIIEVR